MPQPRAWTRSSTWVQSHRRRTIRRFGAQFVERGSPSTRRCAPTSWASTPATGALRNDVGTFVMTGSNCALGHEHVSAIALPFPGLSGR